MATVVRKPVKSSNIISVGHDPETDTLEVEFKGGGIYQYHGVSAKQHFDMLQSGSIGGHFHSNIRNNHQNTKIK